MTDPFWWAYDSGAGNIRNCPANSPCTSRLSGCQRTGRSVPLSSEFYIKMLLVVLVQKPQLYLFFFRSTSQFCSQIVSNSLCAYAHLIIGRIPRKSFEICRMSFDNRVSNILICKLSFPWPKECGPGNQLNAIRIPGCDFHIFTKTGQSQKKECGPCPPWISMRDSVKANCNLSLWQREFRFLIYRPTCRDSCSENEKYIKIKNKKDKQMWQNHNNCSVWVMFVWGLFYHFSLSIWTFS